MATEVSFHHEQLYIDFYSLKDAANLYMTCAINTLKMEENVLKVSYSFINYY